MVATFNNGEDKSEANKVSEAAAYSSGGFLHTRLNSLRQLTQIANTAPSFEAALAQSLQVIADTLKAEQAVVLVYDSTSNTLIPHSSNYGFTSQQAMKLETVYLDSEEPSLSKEAFQRKQPFISNDCYNDPACNYQRVRQLNIRNELAMPIYAENHVVGVCLVFNKKNSDFNTEDSILFETMSIPIATLLKNSGLVTRLQNEQRRHLAVLDAAVDGFIEVDRDFKIILFNKGAENLTNWPAEAAMGRTCSEVLMPHNPDGTLLCHTCPLKRSFRYGLSVSNVETLIHTRDGEDNWTSCSYNAVTNEQGEVISGVIAIKDIYRLKALGDELQQQIQQQQTLLGVINAINGLSNIEEIYHRALDEIRKAIHFDVGTIHAIEEDGKHLRLVSHYEVAESEVITDALPDAEENQMLTPLETLHDELADSNTHQLAEYYAFEQATRIRQAENNYSFKQIANTTAHSVKDLKVITDCEALCQNEPYMAVNLPGKPVCGVLSDFPGLQSHICVPIKTQDCTYGVLHLAAYRAYAFWGSDFGLAYNISKQIAVAAERANLFEKIERLARTDQLTNLYNKLEFWERIDKELKRAERQMEPLTLMVLDLDRLKWFNDYYGHAYGDILLSQIAQVVKQKSRATDMAFRFGGDELCLLLPNTNAEEARVVAERIRKAVAEVSVLPSRDVIGAEGLVTMSIGVAAYPRDAQTAHDLFLCADAAQYRAKNTGKNRVCVYDYEIDHKNLTSHRRNPSDYDRFDERLSLPAANATQSEKNNAFSSNSEVESGFNEDIDPTSQYDIEVLPDPNDEKRP